MLVAQRWRIENERTLPLVEIDNAGIGGLHPLERLAAAQLQGRPLDAVGEGRERLEVELELPQPVEHAPVLDVGGVVVVRRRERLGLVHRERVDGAERDERERGEAGEHPQSRNKGSKLAYLGRPK